MIRTQIYILDEIHKELKYLAKLENTNLSQLIREGAKIVIKKGIKKTGRKHDPLHLRSIKIYKKIIS